MHVCFCAYTEEATSSPEMVVQSVSCSEDEGVGESPVGGSATETSIIQDQECEHNVVEDMS